MRRGYVRLVHPEADGRVVTRMLLGRGGIFGDLPFRPGFHLADEQAFASGSTSVIELQRGTLEHCANEKPQFQATLLKTLSSQYQALDRRLQWQLINPLKRRIATALMDLASFSGTTCGHGHLVDIRLTHEEFAELVVAARPVVSAILGDLKKTQIIDYTRAHLCLLDMDRLKLVAEAG